MPVSDQKNVLGGPLEQCSLAPLTGWTRSGCCETDEYDRGMHTVCVVVTEEFLRFSKSVGNDLSTPRPEYGFHGLKEDDRWCLCATRWEEARVNGCAPLVVLEATNGKTLEVVALGHLQAYAPDDRVS